MTLALQAYAKLSFSEVRFWPKCEVPTGVRKRLLLGVDRTYGGHHEIDASDPKRSFTRSGATPARGPKLRRDQLPRWPFGLPGLALSLQMRWL